MRRWNGLRLWTSGPGAECTNVSGCAPILAKNAIARQLRPADHWGYANPLPETDRLYLIECLTEIEAYIGSANQPTVTEIITREQGDLRMAHGFTSGVGYRDPQMTLDDAPDNRPGLYYVDAQYNGRTVLLSGPWANHADALARVDACRRYVAARDSKSVWYAYGTCRIEPDGLPVKAGRFTDAELAY